jgi:hypothetical protein
MIKRETFERIIEQASELLGRLTPFDCVCDVTILHDENTGPMGLDRSVNGRSREPRIEAHRFAKHASCALTELVPLGFRWRLGFKFVNATNYFYTSDGHGIGELPGERRHKMLESG